MNDCVIIILGATGDLAKRKIFPALYNLFITNKLGNSYIMGAALDHTDALSMLSQAKKYIQVDDEAQWNAFCKRVDYTPINFLQEQDFKTLAAAVAQQEKKAQLPGNRLVYCATAPYFYCGITKGLAQSGLVKKHIPARMVRDALRAPHHERGSFSVRPEELGTSVSKDDHPWQRIVYEKPFGHDLESAHGTNECIAKYFDESQIFRIDHYLTKELVSNIALVRFTNIVFEPLWNHRYIDHVQIVFDEKEGISGRGLFYDKYGALADVMQNHMMQLVALIAMESPEKLTGEYIRAERAKVLQKVKVVDAVLGQYKGYTHEAGVDQNSKIETFAQVMLRIENPRWAGVPFYLKTGKCLDKKETAIYIKFKQVDCLLTKACPSESNYLKIEISPDPVFSLTLNAKKPGKTDEVIPLQMRFSHETYQHEVQAYQTLFEEILKGEQSVSVRFDEIESAWKIIDTIRALKPALFVYEKGSQGPQEARIVFDTKHGMKWKR